MLAIVVFVSFWTTRDLALATTLGVAVRLTEVTIRFVRRGPAGVITGSGWLQAGANAFSTWLGLDGFLGILHTVFMRANSSAEAALHIVILMAAAPGGGEIAAGDLARFHALSPDTVAKVLQHLTAVGVVTASPGRTGGYKLARSPDRVSMLDVVDALGGVAPDFNCREIRRSGPCSVRRATYSPRCAVARAMDEAAEAWRQSLARVSIAALMRDAAREAPGETLAKTQAWLGDHIR